MSYIYKELTPTDLADMAEHWGRLDNFGGWQGWERFAKALIAYAESTGEPLEVDIIALCCEFSHAADWYDAANQLGLVSDNWDTTQAAQEVTEYLNDNTWLAVAEDDCIIWQDF